MPPQDLREPPRTSAAKTARSAQSRATPAGSAAAERLGRANATTRLAIMPYPAAHPTSPGRAAQARLLEPHTPLFARTEALSTMARDQSSSPRLPSSSSTTRCTLGHQVGGGPFGESAMRGGHADPERGRQMPPRTTMVSTNTMAVNTARSSTRAGPPPCAHTPWAGIQRFHQCPQFSLAPNTERDHPQGKYAPRSLLHLLDTLLNTRDFAETVVGSRAGRHKQSHFLGKETPHFRASRRSGQRPYRMVNATRS